MRDEDMHVGSDQCLNVPNYENAAHEMNDVLLHRLPSFYRSAYRLLGNAADAEDAVQDLCLPPTSTWDSSEDSRRCLHG
jgi:hypothetical protein